jgi:hypothetical protein
VGGTCVGLRASELARTSFDDIISWASSDGTFAYEVTWESVPESIREKQKKSKSKSKSKPGAPHPDEQRISLRHVFITKEGAVISDSLKRCVNLVLEREEKKLNGVLQQYSSTLADSASSSQGDEAVASVASSLSASQLCASASAASLLSSAHTKPASSAAPDLSSPAETALLISSRSSPNNAVLATGHSAGGGASPSVTLPRTDPVPLSTGTSSTTATLAAAASRAAVATTQTTPAADLTTTTPADTTNATPAITATTTTAQTAATATDGEVPVTSGTPTQQ